MQKTRQKLSQGNNAIDGSGWELDQPKVSLGAVASGTTIPILGLGPSNLGSPLGVNPDAFTGTALAIATATKAVGVPNTPIGILDGAWLFSALAGAGASTLQLQVVSAGAGTSAPVTSNISAAIAFNTMLQGWNSLLLAPNAERQAVVGGVARPTVCLLYPGDIIQVVTAGGVAIPAATVLVLDVA